MVLSHEPRETYGASDPVLLCVCLDADQRDTVQRGIWVPHVEQEEVTIIVFVFLLTVAMEDVHTGLHGHIKWFIVFERRDRPVVLGKEVA